MNSISISFPILPFSYIVLTIYPSISPDAFWSSINIITMIYAAIRKFFIAFSIFEITLPLSLIYVVVAVNYKTLAMSFSIDNLSIISGIFIFFEFKILRTIKLNPIDDIRSCYIVLKLTKKRFGRTLTLYCFDIFLLRMILIFLFFIVKFIKMLFLC